MRWTHLNCRTNDGSLLKSLLRRDDLLSFAEAQGHTHVAITELHTMFRYSRFIVDAQERGLQPVVGCTVSMLKDDGDHTGRYSNVTLLALNSAGLEELGNIVTRSYGKDSFYWFPRVKRSWLVGEASNNLLLLTGGSDGLLFPLFQLGKMDELHVELDWLDDTFCDSWYLEVQYHGLEEQRSFNEWAACGDRVIATNCVQYAKHDDAELLQVVSAIDRGRTLGKTAVSFNEYHRHLKTYEEMKLNEQLGVLPAGSVDMVSKLLGLFTQYDIDKTNTKLNVKLDVVDAATRQLEILLKDVGEDRHEEYKNRLQYEIRVIDELGFLEYFASVAEVIQWAKDQRFLVGPGRGSVGASLFAYLLGITQFDPLAFPHLIFERFLAPGRVAPPDIDWDIERSKRAAVLQHVADKYNHIAQIGTFNVLHDAAAIKDVGRVLEIPFSVSNNISSRVVDVDDVPEELQNVMKEENAQWLEYVQAVKGLVRHFSVHAAGVVISQDPINIPMARKSDSDDMVVQVDKDDLEGLHGLLKYDYLGLTTLDKIAYTIDIIKNSDRSKELWFIRNPNDIWLIPLDDEATFDLLRRGDTANVFQMEKKSFADMCKDLSPDSFLDVMAANALHRPGAMETGQHTEFIERKHERKIWQHLHQDLGEALDFTYGIILYQEQIMRVARDFAGYDAPEADQLRKIVGKKLVKLIDAEGEKFVQCSIDRKGRDEADARRIFDLIKPAARYSWNIAHACAYSIISYVTAYLKAHFPAEYFAATMAIESDTTKIADYRGDLVVYPPDVNVSDIDPVVSGTNEVRLGLSNIKGVGKRAASSIVRNRELRGEYLDADDMRGRISVKTINSSGMRSLWMVGALDSVGLGRDVMTNLQRWSFERQLCGTPNPDLTHPLSEIESETILALQNRPIHWKGTLACYIQRVHRIKTKNDEHMAFISIEDSMSNVADVVCFPYTWRRVQRIVQVGRCINMVVDVKPNRDDSGLQFVCDGASLVLENQGTNVFSELNVPLVAQPAKPDKWRDLKNARAWDARIAMTDIESTGLDHKGRTDRVIELASAIFHKGVVVDQKSWLIDPCRSIPHDSYVIHGITDEMVVGCPIFSEIAQEWLEFIKDCVLCGHNFKSFDRHMIAAEMDTAGVRMPKIPVIDTMTMVRRYDKPQDQEGGKLPPGWLKLENACERNGVSNVDAHRALGDSIATGELFYKLLSRGLESDTLISTLVR